MLSRKIDAGTLLITFSMLFMAACGGQAQVNITSKTDNAQLNLTLGHTSSLKEMESDIFDSFGSFDNCVYADSPHAWRVRSLLDSLNGVLYEMPGTDPYIQSVLPADYPPREEYTVAVYLCDDLQSTAYALHLSLFLSNRFLDELLLTARQSEREDDFLSAAGFILYHELGHALLGHSKIKIQSGDEYETTGESYYANNFDFPQEIEADEFAYNALLRTGVGVDGVDLAIQAGAQQ